MSAPNPNGGPAFPYAFKHEDDSRYTSGGFAPGMTLRDWFAGQALAGALQNYTTAKFGCTENQVAIGAYRYADAMLAARERKEATP